MTTNTVTDPASGEKIDFRYEGDSYAFIELIEEALTPLVWERKRKDGMALFAGEKMFSQRIKEESYVESITQKLIIKPIEFTPKFQPNISDRFVKEQISHYVLDAYADLNVEISEEEYSKFEVNCRTRSFNKSIGSQFYDLYLLSSTLKKNLPNHYKEFQCNNENDMTAFTRKKVLAMLKQYFKDMEPSIKEFTKFQILTHKVYWDISLVKKNAETFTIPIHFDCFIIFY